MQRRARERRLARSGEAANRTRNFATQASRLRIRAGDQSERERGHAQTRFVHYMARALQQDSFRPVITARALCASTGRVVHRTRRGRPGRAHWIAPRKPGTCVRCTSQPAAAEERHVARRARAGRNTPHSHGAARLTRISRRHRDGRKRARDELASNKQQLNALGAPRLGRTGAETEPQRGRGV